MYALYTWTTPNGYKVPMLLEELGLPYEIKPVNISAGEQKTPEYLTINPNNKIPALVDPDAADGPLTIFESGAILLYLAQQHGRFWPQDTPGKWGVVEWLMFQMASVGPMFGQANHFTKYAPEPVPYAIDRYKKEAVRLCRVMDTRLGDAEYFAGEYSVADMATWPWVRAGVNNGYVDLGAHANLKRWFDAIGARPATQAALAKVDAAAAAHKTATQT